MAPKVGLEPTTDRLTADCSTTELLRNNRSQLGIAWRRPTLTGGEPPTTIGAEKLNFRVRYGNGCDLLAIVTRLLFKTILLYCLLIFSRVFRKLFPQN